MRRREGARGSNNTGRRCAFDDSKLLHSVRDVRRSQGAAIPSVEWSAEQCAE